MQSLGELFYISSPGFYAVAVTVAATLPPASVDPKGQDWIPLEGREQ